MQLRGTLVIALGAFMSILSIVALRHFAFEPNLCTMSRNRSSYAQLDFTSSNSKISGKYELYLYREGGLSPRFESIQDVDNLGGTPVLFIPGNAGSYSQGRSLAGLAADKPHYDWFLAHFDEDLSALHGKTLLDEARYVNDAIAYILDLYRQKSDEEVPPTSVIIVAHSMGGIVARTLVTLDNYVENSVNTIITLSTPHVNPPITFDRDVTELYDLVGRWWRNKPEEIDIALVSLAGGHNDLLVLPDMTIIDSLGGISAFSYEVPGVGLGIDHLAIVWCAELRQAIVEAIDRIVDTTQPSRTLPYEEKMARLTSRLKASNFETNGAHLVADQSILLGKRQQFLINGTTNLVLPSHSSLVSYKLRSNVTLNVVHRTEKEAREYDETRETTLMWYSAGPYIPFSKNTQKLTVSLEPLSEGWNNTSLPVSVVIQVDWLATLANIVLHFRTLAASWPYAIVNLTLIFVVCSKNRLSFHEALLSHFVKNWYLRLCVILSLVHCILVHPTVRAAFRAVQLPSEAKNVEGLQKIGFDAHDLLLGTLDLELFWMAPLLLTMAIFLVFLINLTARAVVCLIQLCRYPFCRFVRPGRKALAVSQDSDQVEKVHVTKKKRVSQGFMTAMLICVLYLLPYQISTVVLTVVQLVTSKDPDSITFGINQLLLWTSFVDAPIIAVWIRNLTIEWLWAFASIENVYSSLPIAFFIFFVKPNASGLLVRRSSLRVGTLIILSYIAGYAFVYGGLHAFMLHHLTNYFLAWIVITNLTTE